MNTAEKWHGTTIILLRKDGETIVAGDGQVSLGNTVLKSKAKKVRKIESRGVIAGFAGSTADALTLFDLTILNFFYSNIVISEYTDIRCNFYRFSSNFFSLHISFY